MPFGGSTPKLSTVAEREAARLADGVSPVATIKVVIEFAPEAQAALEKFSSDFAALLAALRSVLDPRAVERATPQPAAAAAEPIAASPTPRAPLTARPEAQTADQARPQPGVPFTRPVERPAATTTAPIAAPVLADKASPIPPLKPAAPAFVETRLYTPAREDVMRFRYPGGMAREAIRQLLNKLPGRSFDTVIQVAGYAKQLGLKRDDGQTASASDDDTQDSRSGVRSSTAKPAPLPPVSGRLTAERRDVLMREYPAGTPAGEIYRMLCELPGPAFPRELIANYAYNLGLRRPAVAKLSFDHTEAPPVEVRRDGPPIISWSDAQKWAAENGINLPPGTSQRAARLIINDARHRHGLPQWDIVEKASAAANGAHAP